MSYVAALDPRMLLRVRAFGFFGDCYIALVLGISHGYVIIKLSTSPWFGLFGCVSYPIADAECAAWARAPPAAGSPGMCHRVSTSPTPANCVALCCLIARFQVRVCSCSPIADCVIICFSAPAIISLGSPTLFQLNDNSDILSVSDRPESHNKSAWSLRCPFCRVDDNGVEFRARLRLRVALFCKT